MIPEPNCQDNEKWCKDIIQSNCEVVVKGVKVKHYCKKTCNLCDKIFVHKYRNFVTSGGHFNDSNYDRNI